MNWPGDFINKVHCADSFKFMKLIPDGVIDICITSPPYWGLRDYGIEQIFGGDKNCEHAWGFSKIEHDNLRYRGHNANVGSNKNPEIHKGKEKSGGQFCCSCGAWKGQLGLEPTPEMYIEHLTEIFNEVKQVLKKEGTLWLNIGDSYWGGKGRSAHGDPERHIKRLLEGKTINKPYQEIGKPGEIKPGDGKHDFIQPKSLCMIPERLGWSLIQNGWILRNKIPWIKPNCMPESMKDRFARKWEYVYYFVKSQRNYFDLDAVRESYTNSTHERMKYTINKIPRAWADEGAIPMSGGKTPNFNISDIGKNPGDVWIIPTSGFPYDYCPKCKKLLVRTERIKIEKKICCIYCKQPVIAHFATFPEALVEKAIIPGCPKGSIVLDPFSGSGRVGVVAKKHGSSFVLIDIKKEYCEMSEKRLAQGVL